MDEDNNRYLVHYHQPGWSYDCVATLPTLESAQRFQTGLTEAGIPSRLEVLPFILVNKRAGDGSWHVLVQGWELEQYSVLLIYFPTNAQISLMGLADFPLALQEIDLITSSTRDSEPAIAPASSVR
ncbi:MAG: hypothetical protein V9E94_10640 [Microthrixaceae bacterium]